MQKRDRTLHVLRKLDILLVYPVVLYQRVRCSTVSAFRVFYGSACDSAV
jgi:hypothetical protein